MRSGPRTVGSPHLSTAVFEVPLFPVWESERIRSTARVRGAWRIWLRVVPKIMHHSQRCIASYRMGLSLLTRHMFVFSPYTVDSGEQPAQPNCVSRDMSSESFSDRLPR